MGTEIILPGRNSRSRCQAIVNDLLFSPHPTQQLFHLRKQPFSLNDVFQCNVEGLSSARLRNLTGYPVFNRRYTHRLTTRPELMMAQPLSAAPTYWNRRQQRAAIIAGPFSDGVIEACNVSFLRVHILLLIIYLSCDIS